MKFSAFVLFSALSSVSAFVAPITRNNLESVIKVNAVAEAVKVDSSTKASATKSSGAVSNKEQIDPRQQILPGRYDELSYSLTLPLLQRPSNLDGSHAGDFGFDPLGLSQEYDLYYMQECELRHARLAMLAVAGWPLSELIGAKFMLQNGCAPSVLNGMSPLAFFSILTIFGAFGFLESQTAFRKTTGSSIGDAHSKDMSAVWKYGVAGDYAFDPAGLYSSLGDDAAGRKGLRELEVTQGRYAMLAITYFAAWEALTGHPIVENNPFFHPNALLPVVSIAYFAWSQIYEISDVREYPINIKYTKDGEDILRNVKRTIEGFSGDFEPIFGSLDKVTNFIGPKIDELKKALK
mmetsp:Transcript_22935/g.26148  ORF Transcript_22935/g.26148 Transcript_22935/m.26148 type:complete len:350 (-) Transcript_22935:180-1229(-)|eukprot:CAMPEP_0194139270 /NCGR_PEP_ID=MMETSP0152-20130528/8948_1 /TAXON_ID=1049557 /ORGANISM="Thalassiothrix antarctica, Strain L6-D1" /LENGTH=349 /DNA_ID=CAMNT_0038837051 /DNA_START=111 /DNA_END=1160 /DNA_ORIENTATION=-